MPRKKAQEPSDKTKKAGRKTAKKTSRKKTAAKTTGSKTATIKGDLEKSIKDIIDEITPFVKLLVGDTVKKVLAENFSVIEEQKKEIKDLNEQLVSLNNRLTEASISSPPVTSATEAKRQDTSLIVKTPKPSSHYDKYREAIYKTIVKLHERDRQTFSEIAQRFDSGGINTFSGRGKWDEETVRQLYMNGI